MWSTSGSCLTPTITTGLWYSPSYSVYHPSTWQCSLKAKWLSLTSMLSSLISLRSISSGYLSSCALLGSILSIKLYMSLRDLAGNQKRKGKGLKTKDERKLCFQNLRTLQKNWTMILLKKTACFSIADAKQIEPTSTHNVSIHFSSPSFQYRWLCAN